MSLSKAAKNISLLILSISILLPGCKTPEEYRKDADKSAYENINTANKALFNRDTEFTIESSEDQLRRRLFDAQGLQYSGKASLGVENLDKPEHWPEKNYPAEPAELDDLDKYKEPLKLSLVEALQIAAGHNFTYQTRKESVFTTALTLDRQEHVFDTIFSGSAASTLTATTSQDYDTVTTLGNSTGAGVSKQYKNGLQVSAGIAYSLAQYLTPIDDSGHSSSMDLSFSMPLLRGSGEHIVTENLTQAERNLIYAVYDFERYKKTFAVGIASSYYNVLQRKNQIENARVNYESVKTSANRSRKLAEAGRMTNIERDQAIQNELNARNSWLSSQETFKTTLDSFKEQLGLPVDAAIILDDTELDNIITYTEKSLNIDLTPSRDGKVEFNDIPGPYELNESKAIKYALENRLDLKTAHGEVFDSQRKVIIMADQLRADVTIGGSASYGDSGELVFDDADYNALLTIDLPIERETERNNYRTSYISLQQAVRSCQSLEDEIKLSVRSKLRDLKDQRNTLQIQAESVRLAEDRVRSSNMFLEAGRIEMRDVLEAEEALLSARNKITASVISYRMAELELQRDMGLLEVDEKGLCHEFKPADDDRDSIKHDNNNQAAANSDNNIAVL